VNVVDKVVNYFAPQTGMARARARMGTRIYEGASVGRRSSSWRALHTSANAELQLAIQPLRDRSRDLVRNTPWAARALKILGAHAIGSGIKPSPMTGSDGLDRRVLDIWNDWQAQCDIGGRLSFYGMQHLALRGMCESGDAVVRMIDRPVIGDRPGLPMKLQLLEADYIDHFRDGVYGDASKYGVIRSRMGVGLGEYDAFMGLWLWAYHPGEITSINMVPLLSTFQPGDNLILLFEPLRPGQVRGVPWFAPVLTTARDMSDFVDAVNMKAKVEACFSAFVQNDDPTLPLFDPAQSAYANIGDQDNPNATVSTLEPGMIKELRTGQSITFAQPTSNTQAEPMLLFNLMSIAAGLGITYDQIQGDLRQANYSSLRAGKIEFRSMIQSLQDLILIPNLCQRVWDRFISRAVLAGYLRPRQSGYPVEWVTPAWQPVDPQKDLDADVRAVRAGQMTPQQFIMANGGDWERNMKEFESFFLQADKHGLVFDIDPRKVDIHGRQPSSKSPGQQTAVDDFAAEKEDDADAADRNKEDA
jgi:lambda family phage portal protein